MAQQVIVLASASVIVSVYLLRLYLWLMGVFITNDRGIRAFTNTMSQVASS